MLLRMLKELPKMYALYAQSLKGFAKVRYVIRTRADTKLSKG